MNLSIAKFVYQSKLRVPEDCQFYQSDTLTSSGSVDIYNLQKWYIKHLPHFKRRLLVAQQILTSFYANY